MLKNIYLPDSFAREVLRVLIFLFILAFYVSSTIGAIVGLCHLVLAILQPKEFGMSRILVKILSRN